MKLWKNVLPKNTNQAVEKRDNHNLLRLPSKVSNTSKQLNTLFTPQHKKHHQQNQKRGYSEIYKSENNMLSKTLNEDSGLSCESSYKQDRNSQNKDSEVEVVQFENSTIFDIKQQLMNAFEESYCQNNNEKLSKIKQLKTKVSKLNTLVKQTKQQFQLILRTFQTNSSQLISKVSNQNSKRSNTQPKYLSQLETNNKKLMEELSYYQNINSDLTDRLYRQQLKLATLQEQQKRLKSTIDELKQNNIRLEEEIFSHEQKSAQIQLEIINRVQKLISSEGSGEILGFSKQTYQDEIKLLSEEVENLRKMVEACSNSNLEQREKILIEKQKVLESNYAELEKMLIETDYRVQQVSFKEQCLAQESKNLHHLKLQLQNRQQQISAIQSQIIQSSSFTAPSKNYDTKIQSTINHKFSNSNNQHLRNKSLTFYHDQVDDKKKLNYNSYLSSVGMPSATLLRSNSSSKIHTSLLSPKKRLFPHRKKWDGHLGELSNKIERLRCELKQEIRAAK